MTHDIIDLLQPTKQVEKERLLMEKIVSFVNLPLLPNLELSSDFPGYYGHQPKTK